MHVTADCSCVWMRRYAASISVLLIRIGLLGCWHLMSCTACRNHNNVWLYLHSLSSSFITCLLQVLLGIPGKVQSCVVLFFSYRSFFLLIDHCIATPRGVMHVCLMCLILLMVMGMACWESTSLSNDFVSASFLIFVFAD